MSNMVFSSSSRQFTIGSVLGDAVKILFAHPRLFFGLAFVAWLPGALLAFLVPRMLISFSNILISPVNFIMTLFIQGAASIALFSLLQGRVTDIRTSLSVCMGRVKPLFALSLTEGLINLPTSVAIAFVKMNIVAFIAKTYIKITMLHSRFGKLLFRFRGMKDHKNHFGGNNLSFLVMLLSFFIMSILYLSVPACVMERRGPFDSLQRSTDLTLGYRVRIFGLVAISSFIYYCFFCLSSILLLVFSPWPQFLLHLLTQILMFVPHVFFCLLPPVVYYRLLELKEGVTPAQTAGANTAP